MRICLDSVASLPPCKVLSERIFTFAHLCARPSVVRSRLLLQAPFRFEHYSRAIAAMPPKRSAASTSSKPEGSNKAAKKTGGANASSSAKSNLQNIDTGDNEADQDEETPFAQLSQMMEEHAPKPREGDAVVL